MKTSTTIPMTSNIMLPEEKRNSSLLAGVYALRLLGIFLLLPVFSLYAQGLAGGENKAMVGFAFGVYGLTQALLQLPLGMASDRFGRKKVIFLGLIVFALGSFLSAFAHSVEQLAWARALQGAGAVSAVLVALLADLTRDEVRTRAMAMIGLSIAMTFSVSLVIGPLLSHWIGVRGIFILTGILILLAILVIVLFVPTPQKVTIHEDAQAHLSMLPCVLKNKDLWRLNFGIFALHCAQMALFFALPLVLYQHFHFAHEEHWKLYLPVTIIGIIFMIPAVIVGEKKHKLKSILIFSIILLAIAQTIIGIGQNHLWAIITALCLYFIGLNIAEAILPSWVSKICPPKLKGTAMGVYNTSMSIGLVVGSSAGGLIMQYYGASAVFYFCSTLMLVWAVVAILGHAPKPVKTLIFSLPETWQNQAESLNCQISQLQGVVETSISRNNKTLYLKVMQHGFDETRINQIIYGESTK